MDEYIDPIYRIEDLYIREFAYIHPRLFSRYKNIDEESGFDSVMACADDTGICLVKRITADNVDECFNLVISGKDLGLRLRKGIFKYRKTLAIMVFESGLTEERALEMLKHKVFNGRNRYYPLIIDTKNNKFYYNLLKMPLSLLEMVIKLKKDFTEGNTYTTGSLFETELNSVISVEDFRNNLFRSHKYVTWFFIVINIIVWVFLKQWGGEIDSTLLMKYGAKAGPLIWEGEIWRLVTPLFLHVTLLHLFSNCAVLFLLGGILEALTGRWRLTVIYLLSGVAGNIASLAFSSYLSAGASSGVFGIFGALIVYGFLHKNSIPRNFYRLIMLFLFPFIIYNLVVGFFYGQSDNFAHLGGFVGGALICASMGVQYPEDKSGRIRWKMVAATAFIFALSLSFALKPYDAAYGVYYMVMGGEKSNKSEYASAVSYLMRSLEILPENSNIRSQLGQIYFELGNSRYKKKNFKAAAVYYKNALRFFQLDPGFYAIMSITCERLGDCLAGEDKNSEALKSYKAALILKPGEKRLKQLISYEYRILANYSYDGFDYDKAIELCEKSIEADPENYEARKLLGYAYYRKGMLSQAAQIWKEAYDLEPRLSEFRSMLQDLIFKDLISSGGSTVKGNASVKAWELNRKGEEYLISKGDFESAYQKFMESTKEDPHLVVPLLNLARINIAFNDNKDAEVFAGKAARLSPGDPDVLVVLARIAINESRYDAASGLLEKCLVKSPNSAQCLGWKGILARRMKKSGEAEKNLTKSVELDPDNLHFRIELARACFDNKNPDGFYRHCNEALVYAISRNREDMALYIRMLLREKSEKRI